jgi:AcrR family transcriptional regulator
MASRTPEAGPEANTAIPLPPWQRPAPPPARAPITRVAIVDAALVVLDKVGMDGLSMRRVAEELGTGAASLYWHVRNKEELLQLIFDRVMDEFTLPVPDPAHWQQQLRAAANQALAALTRHRDVGRISLGRVPGGPQSAVIGEWFFTLLAPVGIPDRVIAYLGDFFGLYVGAYAFEQSLGIASPTGEEMPPEAIAQMLEDYVKSLPADRFPYVTRAAHLLFGGDRQERWEFGLDLMLRGLESYVDRKGGSRRGGNARDVAAPRSLTRKGT